MSNTVSGDLFGEFLIKKQLFLQAELDDSEIIERVQHHIADFYKRLVFIDELKALASDNVLHVDSHSTIDFVLPDMEQASNSEIVACIQLCLGDYKLRGTFVLAVKDMDIHESYFRDSIILGFHLTAWYQEIIEEEVEWQNDVKKARKSAFC